MQKYGYIPPPTHPADEMPKMNPRKTKKTIQKMQMMMGVEMTGELDDVTMAMINKPRCGVHDPVQNLTMPPDDHEGNGNRALSIETGEPLNFMHTNNRWPTTDITYRYIFAFIFLIMI